MALVWSAALLATLGYARMAIYGLLAGQDNPYLHEHFFLPILGTLCLIPFVLLAGFVLAVRGFRHSPGMEVPRSAAIYHKTQAHPG
jgi:hypothetical protein